MKSFLLIALELSLEVCVRSYILFICLMNEVLHLTSGNKEPFNINLDSLRWKVPATVDE